MEQELKIDLVLPEDKLEDIRANMVGHQRKLILICYFYVVNS